MDLEVLYQYLLCVTDFGFWLQVYDDTSEGKKVCTYYKLDSIPVVLVIDPITGQKMRSWCGMVQPESLLEVYANYVYHCSKLKWFSKGESLMEKWVR